MMRLLGVKTWACVLEFQSSTGEGWPHWHVLIDRSTAPRGRIDYDRVVRLWLKTWRIGLWRASKERYFADSRHAVHYVTKYLTKPQDGGYPSWVQTSRRAIRFVSASKSLGPLVSHALDPADAAAIRDDESDLDLDGTQADPPEEPRARRSLLDRMSECGMSSVLWSESADPETGEATYAYATRVHVPPDSVREALALPSPEAPTPQPQAPVEPSPRSRRPPPLDLGYLRRSDVFAAVYARFPDVRRQHVNAVASRRFQLISDNRFARREAWQTRRRTDDMDVGAAGLGPDDRVPPDERP